jgi:hypothetical protein
MANYTFPRTMFTAGLALQLLLFSGTSVKGQESAAIAPPSNTDTFAETDSGHRIRVQHGELAKGNFQIAGVDLAGDTEALDQAARSLGTTSIHRSGDASASLAEACYQADGKDDNTLLIMQRGEVSPSFVLTVDRSYWKWKTACRKTWKVNKQITTASGLRLDLTQEQVLAILGLPTRRSHSPKIHRDSMAYEFLTRKKTDPKSFLRARQVHPEMSERDLEENYGKYDLSESINIEFLNGSLVLLEVGWSATT